MCEIIFTSSMHMDGTSGGKAKRFDLALCQVIY